MAEKEEKKQDELKALQTPNQIEPDNTLILHYEEMDGIDLRIDILPADIADYICKTSVVGKDTFQLSRSKDLAHRLTGAAVAFAFAELESRFDIRSCLGWYPIVEEDEGFYKYMKQRYWEKASRLFYAKKLKESPNNE